MDLLQIFSFVPHQPDIPAVSEGVGAIEWGTDMSERRNISTVIYAQMFEMTAA